MKVWRNFVILAVLSVFLFAQNGLALEISADGNTPIDLSEIEVKGLYYILKKYNNAEGPIKTPGDYRWMSAGETTGNFVESAFRIHKITNVSNPYKEAWSATGIVKGTFQLHKVNLENPNSLGGVTTTNTGVSSNFQSKEDITFTWNPNSKKLYPLIRYPECGAGSVEKWGTYNVKGISKTTVTTSGKGFNFGLNASLKDMSGSFSFGVSKTQAVKTSNLKANISGLPFCFKSGKLFFERYQNVGKTVIAVGQDWNTDVYMDWVPSSVPVTTTNCVQANAVGGSLSFNFAKIGGGIGFGKENITSCQVLEGLKISKIKFIGTPMTVTLDGTQGSTTKTGAAFRNHFIIGGWTTSQPYAHVKVGLTCLTNWSLSVDGISGGFTIGSNKLFDKFTQSFFGVDPKKLKP